MAARLEAKRKKRVQKRGYVAQRMASTLNRTSYKRRFFELDQTKLMGFVDEADAARPDAHPVASWALIDFVGAMPGRAVHEVELAASINGGADRVLRCESAAERDAWVTSLDAAIRAARGAPTAVSGGASTSSAPSPEAIPAAAPARPRMRAGRRRCRVECELRCVFVFKF